MRGAFLAGLIFLFAGAASPAPAADAYGDCSKYVTDDNTVKQGIAICGCLIASGKHKGLDLSRLLSNRAAGYIKDKNLDRALADVDRALSISPDYAFGHSHRGEVLRLRGDFDGAVTAYNTAIRLDPSFIVAYYDRAGVHLKRGDRQKARADYQATLDLKGQGRPIDVWAKDAARKALESMAKEN